MSIVGSVTNERLALEADRLLNDEFLAFALAEMRNDALEKLVFADADDKTKILRFQQKVAVIDEVLATLKGYMLKSPKPATSGPV